MAATVLEGVEEVKAAAGSHLGHSDWTTVTPDHVERFAQATDATDAGGDGTVPRYLLVGLSNLFLPQIVDVRKVSLGVNYGCDSIRFPAAVNPPARVRAGAELIAVADIAGGVQTTMIITLEADGTADPVCVIESVSRYLT